MRHLCNWGASLISCVCSAFMIQQIARKRKPSWVMLCNFEYLESRWYFSQCQLQFCKCFPVAMVKALWSKSSQREAGSPLIWRLCTDAVLQTGPAKDLDCRKPPVSVDLSSVALRLCYLIPCSPAPCQMQVSRISDTTVVWYSLLGTKFSKGKHL